MILTDYKKKRDFKNTPEPSDKSTLTKGELQFVVQRHDASHLHYDFRLELDGVLKSWAIPKGPSLNPKDKRLAVMVEDHPLSYGKFQGTIPKGNYGAGTVEIWDSGTYAPEKSNSKNPAAEIRKGLRSGSLKFIIKGKKLKGSFALVRLNDGKEKNWLLIKHRDEHAVDEFAIESFSAVKQNGKKAAKKSVRSGGKKVANFIKPMLATLSDTPFDDPEWLYEIKWDGYRAIAEIKKGNVKLYSRNGLSFLDLYPEIADELRKIKSDVILDGEIVVLNKDDKPSFQNLQNFAEDRSQPILYYVFDCLSSAGNDITDLTLLERKNAALKILPKSNCLKYSDHVKANGKEFFKEIVTTGGLEGMIAKKATSVYEKGRRSKNWLKIKNHNTQEAIICGYTAPRSSRKHFGALILGIREKGKLKYIGHAGTGFTDKLLKELFGLFQPLIIESSPFATKVPINAHVTWLKPTLVCNVKYSELTDEGIMRHPVFMGLRIDKTSDEVNHMDKKMSEKKKESGKGKGKDEEVWKIEGHELTITNRQKIFWPEDGLTKGDVIDYYNSIASYILPYLKDRPQSLKRNPNGILDKGFYHKDAGESAPNWVQHKKIFSESASKDIDYILCNNKATLLYLNNLGCIELNPWNSTIQKPDHPDYMVIDIDPSEKNSFDQVIDVALVIKEILDKAGATSYCKTSGATGLHVYVPFHAVYSYEQTRSFAELVAELARQQLPDFSTLERPLNKRKDRIYIDYLQNKRGQTLASVYSVRPIQGASVSTPLHWKEVKHGLQPLDFTIKNVSKRIAKTGDIFGPVLKEKNNLEKFLKKLDT
ncbi:MAG: DNA ligase D [Chryseolinea sp.]